MEYTLTTGRRKAMELDEEITAALRNSDQENYPRLMRRARERIHALEDNLPMSKIYVVMGTTGEYSDRQEWPVHAHMTEAAAVAEICALVAKAKEIGVHSSNCRGIPEWNERKEIAKELGDPGATIDYTGVDWSIMSVDIANVGGSS
jgi:hypothetical protein